MRLFTAFELPAQVIDEVCRLQEELSPLPFRRWQPVATLHLTLHFLGEVDPELLDPLEAALREGCSGFGPFQLQLDRLGAFPSLRRPRTLWLGLSGERERLSALEATLRPLVTALGIPLEDRPYSPHITLARDPLGPITLPEVVVRPLAWQVPDLVLFHSSLQRGGAIHTPLGRFRLR